MSRNIEKEALNDVTIVGTLLDASVKEGKSKKDGSPYRYGTMVIRVNQTYLNKEETSEIPIRFFSMKYKKDGGINKIYQSYEKFGSMQTAANYGIAEASRVKITGSIEENMFVSTKDINNVVSTCQFNMKFFDEVHSNSTVIDTANFKAEIYITSISREMNSEGEETGRLKIRGGLVKYGKTLDMLDFFVEDPDGVDYFERNYQMNDTVLVKGRIRYTSEEVEYHSNNAWGEDIPDTTTRTKKELIITYSNPEAYDEDLAYDPADVKTANQERNNRKEQLKIDARNKTVKKAETSSNKEDEYGWE